MIMARQNQYFPQSRPHPGETLAEKMDEMGMGPKEFALRTGKPEKTIIAILKGDSPITPDMAVQFEAVTKIPANFWMNHQRNYDEYLARLRHQETLEEAISWVKLFPVADMIRNNWLPATPSGIERAAALLSFFGFANPSAWDEYYLKRELKVAFRISLKLTKQPYAISAWLRQGELQAASLSAPTYSEKNFKSALDDIRSVMAVNPGDFFHQLQTMCLNAGVKVVYTPGLPKAPISGCSRWLNDTPLIQLTNRYKRYDSFWFTFFHEAGHIIKHGKKDIFLEMDGYSDNEPEKEKEADEFAASCILSKQQETEIVSNLPLQDLEIKRFAARFNTHPSMIIGRLLYLGRISYKEGRGYLVPVAFD